MEALSVVLTSEDDHGDSIEDATGITLGSTLEAQINYDQDSDYFRIIALQHTQLTVKSVFESGAIGNVYIYDATGTLLKSGQSLTEADSKGYGISNYLVQPGVYYIRVYSAKAGGYRLSLN